MPMGWVQYVDQHTLPSHVCCRSITVFYLAVVWKLHANQGVLTIPYLGAMAAILILLA